jgi:zinc transporter ZupT
MIGFAATFGATLASFIVPAFIGIGVISFLAKYLKARYLAALGIGIYLWFFSDTIGDASYLGVDEGFTGGGWHVLLWVLFAVGLLLFFMLDKDMFTPGPAGVKFGFAIPLLIAVAVGLHGFGEGAAIGATAATTPSTNIVDAFGGATAGLAFVLHKTLEPMMVGIAYWVYAKERATTPSALLRDTSVMVGAFTLPGIIGSATAYYIVQVYPSADFTYVFALGLGTSIYALFRLARGIYEGTESSKNDSLKIGLMVLLGFTCLYVAALLHS